MTKQSRNAPWEAITTPGPTSTVLLGPMSSVSDRRRELDPPTRLASLFHHLDRHRRALESTSTLGTAELRLLWLLSDGRPRTLREVPHELHLEQSTVNRQANAAVRAGHLQRTRVDGAYRYGHAVDERGSDGSS